jgi:penicillin-binding protein 1A
MPDPRAVIHSSIRVLAALGAVLLLVFGGIGLAVLGTYYYLAPTLPDVATLKDVRLQVPLRVYTRDGRLLAQIGEQRRIPVAFGDIPPRLMKAFLAAEDDRFFQHGGIDAEGLLRAMLVTAVSGEARQGGSTITMQLARNMFLSSEKKVRRKLREIFLAQRIETEFSKEEILTLYLNKIFLGQRAYGVAAAAEVYFGKRLPELSLAEQATLAGLPKAPSDINPIASPERATARRSYVLRRMLEKGYVTREEYEQASATAMLSQEHGPRVEIEAPYVAEMVRAELAARYGEEAYTAGLRVVTSIDSRLQRAADWSLKAALIEYDRRHGYRGPLARVAELSESAIDDALEERREAAGLVPAVVTDVQVKAATVETLRHGTLTIPFDGGISWAHRADDRAFNPVPPKDAREVLAKGQVVYALPAGNQQAYLAQIPAVQGAFVSLDPADGGITALVGGFDYYESKFNRVIQARRQPGSSFKPFIYSGALEQGFTPATIVLDAPVVYDAPGQEDSWRPANDSRHFYGPTRLRDALAYSRNLVTIRVLRSIGVDYASDYATRFGFAREELPHNLTLGLGTAQLTPLEMVTGYAVFANGGYKVQPYFIDRIEDANGQLLYASTPLIVCRAACAGGAPASRPVAAAGGLETPVGESGAALDPRQLAPAVISPANDYIMTDLMRDVIRKGTGRRALVLNRQDIAGKTGTTNDRRDTWFSGFNTAIVATAWVGFDQERSLGPGEEGGHTALPMWVYFMGEALKGTAEHRLPQPDGVVSARISPRTGQLAAAGEADALYEIFLAGKLPGAGGITGDAAAAANEAPAKEGEEAIF